MVPQADEAELSVQFNITYIDDNQHYQAWLSDRNAEFPIRRRPPLPPPSSQQHSNTTFKVEVRVVPQSFDVNLLAGAVQPLAVYIIPTDKPRMLFQIN